MNIRDLIVAVLDDLVTMGPIEDYQVDKGRSEVWKKEPREGRRWDLTLLLHDGRTIEVGARYGLDGAEDGPMSVIRDGQVAHLGSLHTEWMPRLLGVLQATVTAAYPPPNKSQYKPLPDDVMGELAANDDGNPL
jgi:hypothetical protein